MGEDKTLLPFGEFNSLIHFQYERLKSFFENIFISSKEYKFDFIEENNPIIVYDTNKNISSPLIALKSILEQINSEKVLILTADTPFVQISTLIKLIVESHNYEITIASSQGKTQNLCGVFSKSLLSKIDSMLEEDIHKIGFLIKQSHTHIVEFSVENEFLNLNTKSEYYHALNLIKINKLST